MRCEKCGAYVEYGEHLCEVCKCMEKIMNNPETMYKEDEQFEIIDLDEAIDKTLDLTLPTTEAMKNANTPVITKPKFEFNFNKNKVSFAAACFAIVFCLVIGSIGYSMSFSSPKNIYANVINEIFKNLNEKLYLENSSKLTFAFSSNISNINDEYHDFYNFFNSIRANGVFYNNYDAETYKLELDYKYKNYDQEHIDSYVINNQVYLLNSNVNEKYITMNSDKIILDKYIFNSNNKKLLDGLQVSLNELIKNSDFEVEDVIVTINKKDVLTSKMTLYISERSENIIKYNFYKYIKKYSLYAELAKYMNITSEESKNLVTKYISTYDSSNYDNNYIYYVSLYSDKNENNIVKLEMGTTDLYDSKIIEVVVEKEDNYKIKYIKNNKLFMSGTIETKEKGSTNYLNIDFVDLNKNTLVFNLSYKIEKNKKFKMSNFSTTDYNSLEEESRNNLLNSQMMEDMNNMLKSE